MIDYKGLRDCHLNIFWQYDGKPYLENNITKAFINSIDSLSNVKKKEVLFDLFGIKLKGEKIKLEFYLQKKPAVSKIKEFNEDNRLMFAFSPTGKCWGFNGQDTKDEKALFDAIKNELSESYHDEELLINETKKAVEEYLHFQRGDSIPDGWIFVYADGRPEYLVALENKLYNLDPTQINNHIEKSLLISSDKKPVIYKKYSEITDIFEKLNTFITDQFIEYLVLLGYCSVEDFSVACSSDPLIRKGLAIPFGKKILSFIDGGVIDERKWNIPRMHVDYKYLKEINLIFGDNDIRVSLAFGSTQNSGRAMIEKLDGVYVSKDHLIRCKQSFHLMYYRGRNIYNSYIDSNFSFNDYIQYLKKNINSIRKQSPEEAIELYKKMLNDEFITRENFECLKGQLEGKRNPVLVVPEILIEYGWSYEEASKMGLDSFRNELKDKISKTLKQMKL